MRFKGVRFIQACFRDVKMSRSVVSDMRRDDGQLEIRLVSQYFTDQFGVNIDSFSKQSVSNTEAFYRILIKVWKHMFSWSNEKNINTLD